MWTADLCAAVQGRHSVVMVLACREWSRCGRTCSQTCHHILCWQRRSTLPTATASDMWACCLLRRQCAHAKNPSSRSWASISPDYTDEHDMSCIARRREGGGSGYDTVGVGWSGRRTAPCADGKSWMLPCVGKTKNVSSSVAAYAKPAG